jgi:hypothetical protein
MKNPTKAPDLPAAHARGAHLTCVQWLGLVLLAHFAFVCGFKLGRGLSAEIWWVSHIALLMAALGLMLRHTVLWTAALTNVCMLHILWLFDLVCWLLRGWFPLGICGYLAQGDVATWLATLHHIYLLPLLLCLFWQERRYPAAALPTSIAVFLYLTLFSRGLLPPGENINFAFRVTSVTRNPISVWMNQLPDEAYLPALNLITTVAFFLPVAMLLWRCSRPQAEADIVTA